MTIHPKPDTPLIPELPPLFQSSDRDAIQSQRTFFNLFWIQLVALAIAAVAGAATIRTSRADWAGLIALLAILVAGSARARSHQLQSERAWYHSRAIAESVKTLAWRYAVGGNPFELHGQQSPNQLFRSRLLATWDSIADLKLSPLDRQSEQVTSWMRELRKLPLSTRKQQYLQLRLQDQRSWYTTKARHNLRLAKRANSLTFMLEFAGTLAAILKTIQVVSIDLLGLLGVVMASVAAWSQARKYESLGTAYSIAGHELSTIESLMDDVDSESGWGGFVDQAEEAISREHTLWLASR